MRTDHIIVITCLFYVVQACNPIYKFCMDAAKDAVSACTDNNYAVCKCSAEKQVLSCYADCGEGDAELVFVSKQMKRIAKACASPAAEAEALVFGTALPSSSPERGSDPQKAPPQQKQANEEVHAASIPSPIQIIDSSPVRSQIPDNSPEQQAGEGPHQTATTKTSTSDAAQSLMSGIVLVAMSLLVSV